MPYLAYLVVCCFLLLAVSCHLRPFICSVFNYLSVWVHLYGWGCFVRLWGKTRAVYYCCRVVCARGLLLYIKFLLLTILLETTKSCSAVRFAVCPAGAGFLMTGPKRKKSLFLPYFFSFLPFGFISCRLVLPFVLFLLFLLSFCRFPFWLFGFLLFVLLSCCLVGFGL